MPLNPTTIKLTEADKELIEELKRRHGQLSLIGVIREAMLFTLIHKPAKTATGKKSKSFRNLA